MNSRLPVRLLQRLSCVGFVLVWLVHGMLPCVLAEDTTEDDFLGQDEPLNLDEKPDLLPGTFESIARLVGGFVFLLLLMGGVLVLLRRWARPVQSGERVVSLLLEEPIGQKRSICLVRVGEQVLVVGVTPSNISYLTRVDDANLVDSLRQAPSEEMLLRKGWESFRDKLGVGR